MSYLLAARTTEIRKQRLRNSHSQQKQTKKRRLGSLGQWSLDGCGEIDQQQRRGGGGSEAPGLTQGSWGRGRHLELEQKTGWARRHQMAK